jgi:uncharacterized protein (TIGR03437 family)
MPGLLALAALSILAISLCAQNLSAPPWIRQGSVVNAASHLPSSVPGGALAPGALVAIDGLRFDPSAVTVEIESGDKVYPATIVGATAEHIVARMPDQRLSGPGRLFVVSHGKRSVGYEIRSAPGAFGIFTANDQGWGEAKSVIGIAHPGGRVTLSGTGLGHAGTGTIQVLVGGRRASHFQQSTQNGIDRLSFTLPSDTPASCAVPVSVTIGALTGNSATIPVGPGSTCGPARNWFGQMRVPGERSGNVVLLHSDAILELTPGQPVHFMVDNLLAGFAHHLTGKATGPLDLMPPEGACMNWAGPLDSNQMELSSIMGMVQDSSGANLDAGPGLTVSGPNGVRHASASEKKPRIYSAILGGDPPLSRIPPTPLFLAPGNYQVDIPGGSDVGATKAAVEVPDPILWRNRDSVTVLDRSVGRELAWTLPKGYTALVFAWNINRRSSSAGFAVCLPPLRAEEFRIPATAIANLPASGASGSDLSLGFVGVAAVPVEPPSFSAAGLDQARIVSASLSGRSVVVK